MDSTCIIGIQHAIGWYIEYITVHWNGRDVGEVLHQHYQSRNHVAELIQGGSRPFLEGPDDILDEPGEPSKRVRTHQDFFQIKEHDPQYYYLFTADNSWVIYSTHVEPYVQHENVLYST